MFIKTNPWYTLHLNNPTALIGKDFLGPLDVKKPKIVPQETEVMGL